MVDLSSSFFVHVETRPGISFDTGTGQVTATAAATHHALGGKGEAVAGIVGLRNGRLRKKWGD